MKLNECPVCHSQYVGTYCFDGKYNVSCEECSIRTQSYDTEEEAQMRWNEICKKYGSNSRYEGLPIKFQALNPHAVIPTKGDREAACYDLACPQHTKPTQDGSVYIVPLGIAMEIPSGYHAKIYPRSSLPLKFEATLANCVGIIDSGYLNEWKLLIKPFNWTKKDKEDFFTMCSLGARLAQVEFVKNGPTINFIPVSNFVDAYNRGGGFGSTGD